MAFPADDPANTYTAPMDFHEGTVYRVEGTGVSDNFNHTLDFFHLTGGPALAHTSFLASGSLTEQFGGPHPPFDAATACIWSKINKGRVIDGFWGGTCPLSDDGPGVPGGNPDRSTWTANTPMSDVFGSQVASATADIGGWLIRPWEIHDDYDNQWMDDDDLEAEVAAIVVPDGWFLEWEAFHPIFVGFQVAPDEDTVITGLRTEGVTWLSDPTTGWNFYGVDADDNPNWGTGLPPAGTVLATYAGGEADWIDVPESWYPTQNGDRFDGSFVRPDPDDNTTGIPLTLACDSLYPPGGVPNFNGSGGRENQAMLVRAAWRTPQFRFYRERKGIPPRRIRQRSDGATHGARSANRSRNTRQGGNRTVGAIL